MAANNVVAVTHESTGEVRIESLKEEHLTQVCNLLNGAFQSKRFLGCLPCHESTIAMAKRYSKYSQEKWNLGAVAVDSNDIVLGFTQMTTANLPAYPPGLHTCSQDEMYIEVVGVSEKARGMGIGGKLLRWCEGTTKSLNKYAVMSLAVLQGNPAIRLYERHGFVVQEQHDVVDDCCDAIFVCCLFGRPYGWCENEWGSFIMHKVLQ